MVVKINSYPVSSQYIKGKPNKSVVSVRALHCTSSFQTRKSVEISVELGELVDTLQRERDQSVMYLSSIGPETKSYLLKRYTVDLRLFTLQHSRFYIFEKFSLKHCILILCYRPH